MAACPISRWAQDEIFIALPRFTGPRLLKTASTFCSIIIEPLQRPVNLSKGGSGGGGGGALSQSEKENKKLHRVN